MLTSREMLFSVYPKTVLTVSALEHIFKPKVVDIDLTVI